ncbi:MAG: hypothetical protein KF858_03330 [Candidatus Sumerlaeia bacterium]|nr:hypothetical protein [Candidatus Sumerlaeia bacterium]
MPRRNREPSLRWSLPLLAAGLGLCGRAPATPPPPPAPAPIEAPAPPPCPAAGEPVPADFRLESRLALPDAEAVLAPMHVLLAGAWPGRLAATVVAEPAERASPEGPWRARVRWIATLETDGRPARTRPVAAWGVSWQGPEDALAQGIGRLSADLAPALAAELHALAAAACPDAPVAPPPLWTFRVEHPERLAPADRDALARLVAGLDADLDADLAAPVPLPAGVSPEQLRAILAREFLELRGIEGWGFVENPLARTVLMVPSAN